MARGTWRATVYRVARTESDMIERLSTHTPLSSPGLFSVPTTWVKECQSGSQGTQTWCSVGSPLLLTLSCSSPFKEGRVTLLHPGV